MKLIRKLIDSAFPRKSDASYGMHPDTDTLAGLDWEKVVPPGLVDFARINDSNARVRNTLLIALAASAIGYVAVVAKQFPMNIELPSWLTVRKETRPMPDMHSLAKQAVPDSMIAHLDQIKDPTTMLVFMKYMTEQMIKLNSGGKLDECDATKVIMRPWVASDGSLDRFVCKNSQEDTPHTWLMTIIKHGGEFKPWMGFVVKEDGKWVLRQVVDATNLQGSSFANIPGIDAVPMSYLSPVLKKDFKDFPLIYFRLPNLGFSSDEGDRPVGFLKKRSSDFMSFN